jgi:anaerobic magnesium-protoporphyrin IX monomethyl ester cyclase
MPKKVLLITPPYHCGVVESAGRWPHLGFIYIAGALRRAGFEVIIYDAMSLYDGYPEIEAKIKEVQPDFVGSTAYASTLNDAVKVLGLAKTIDPEITTLIGGIHPTFCYEEILEQNRSIVDFCVLGEGEITTPELLTTFINKGDLSKVLGIAFWKDGQVVKTANRPFIENLDNLHPAWDLVDWNDYPLYFLKDSHVAILSSSRGCIHHCSFCSQHKFWKSTYRERDPVKFTDEIEYLFNKYGVNVFFIADEYPTRNRKRWEKILDILIAKNLGVHLLLETCVSDIIRDRDILWRYRKAGILFIYMGVEATNKKRLELFKKDIKFEQSKEAIRLINEAGMISESSVILGMPDETKESIAETFELAKEYGPDFMHFLMIAPWPYANMYNELKPYIEEYDYSKYNLVSPIIKPEKMTRDEVFKEVLNCYKNYYMDKLPQWYKMKGNDLKRSCLLNGMKAIMKNSFLKDHMGGLGKMPKKIEKYFIKVNNPAGNGPEGRE